MVDEVSRNPLQKLHFDREVNSGGTYAQYNTVQNSTVQYSTVQYSTVQYSTVQYSTVQYSTEQCSKLHCITYVIVLCLDITEPSLTRTF